MERHQFANALFSGKRFSVTMTMSEDQEPYFFIHDLSIPEGANPVIWSGSIEQIIPKLGITVEEASCLTI